MLKKWRIVLLALAVLVVLGGAGFVIWGSTPLPPMGTAQAALSSDAQVSVTSGDWLVFQPAVEQARTGLIFYPGGRVDPRAYAPAAHAIARQGYLVVIVPMPLNLAVFDPGAAAQIIAAFPSIQHWAVGGHSLGGSMAANYAKSHPSAVQGLVLWASYPAASDDLSSTSLRVVSISASLDGLATPQKIAASRPLLPSETTWVVIQGGNHAQFGWYGDQPGDHPATLSRQAQQDQTVRATTALLASLP